MFETHSMSFTCTELLLFNYAKVKTVFHSMAPLKKKYAYCIISKVHISSNCAVNYHIVFSVSFGKFVLSPNLSLTAETQ